MNSDCLAIFGEVLFDRFSDGLAVLGGAPFNVAWHLQAFGQSPRLISRIGDDPAGQQVLAAMRRWGMNISNVQTDREHPTGAVTVTICNGEPTYEILDRQAYDFIDNSDQSPSQYRMLYHGSLALRHEVSRTALQTLKADFHGLTFMDVNLRMPWWNTRLIEDWIAEADWVKLNSQEFDQLLPGQLPLERKMQDFIERFLLDGLIVTRGAAGACALTREGDFTEVKPEYRLEVADTVGAGDAFAAVLLLGMQQEWPLSISMERAQIFASTIVGQRGAIVEDRGFYEKLLAEWS